MKSGHFFTRNLKSGILPRALTFSVLFIALVSCSSQRPTTIPPSSTPARSQNTPIASSTPTNPPVTIAPTKTTAPTSTRAPTLTPTLAFNFTLQRQTAQVFLGTAEPLDAVNNDNPQPFPDGFLVNTDQSGQALLQGFIEGEQCKIFLFSTTKLQKKACPQSSFTGGNASCIEEGSAVFENCRNHLITTPSGAAQLLGTWASVTYLAQNQATVYVVLKGSVQIQPVTRMRDYQMASGTLVNAGEFYYTAPDGVMAQNPDLPGRRTYSIDRLPSLLQIYPALNQYLQPISNTSKKSDLNFPDPNLLTGPADLVTRVSSYRYNSRSILELQNQLGGQTTYLPLQITVTNRGGSDSGAFKIAVQGRTENSGDFSRAFLLNGNPNSYYINVDNLPPGGQAVFSGFVAFYDQEPNTTAWVTAEADSCSGDEFMPKNCRVQEYDESNNVSNVLRGSLVSYSRLENTPYP